MYTFTCERASLGKTEVLQKLESAQAAGAVIITTPQAIKSLMLKFVENLTILTDEASKAETFDDETVKLETRTWKGVIDRFHSGVVVMDEVDWVLHPLRSELNFPIGDKVSLDMTKGGERWKLPTVLIDALLFAEAMRKQGVRRLSNDELPERMPKVPGVSVALMEELIQVRVARSKPHLAPVQLRVASERRFGRCANASSPPSIPSQHASTAVIPSFLSLLASSPFAHR